MLDILIILVAAVLIILSLLQSGKSEGISGALTGGTGGLNLFSNVKERGAEKIIVRATLVTGIIFFLLVIIAKIV